MNRWLKGLLGVFVVLAALVGAGCVSGGEGAETTTGYELKGSVVDENSGEPLAAVRVSVGDRQVETDSEGAFTIDDLPEGQYTVEAKKDGYRPDERAVQLSEDTRIVLGLQNESAYLDPSQAALSKTHWENDVECADCHGSPQGEIQDAPQTESCTSCHPINALRNETAEFDPNPHDDPHGYASNCGSCHRVHEPSTNACSGCHSGSIIPEVP